MSLRPSPLVGRAAEVAAIGAVLDEPDGRGALITGPLGVGKTRLANEVLARRVAAGWRTVRIVATAATADIPFGALAAVVGLGRPDGARDAAVDRVVADLADADPDRPLLVAVDDVDLLDESSRQVVRFVAERRIGRVIGTRRTPGDTLTPPWTGAGILHVRLHDLDPGGVAEIVLAALDGPVEGDLTRRLVEATGGNPLVLDEALRAASRDGALRRVDGIWTLDTAVGPTPLLADLVADRLARLGDEGRDAVELVAVAEVLPVPLAERLVDPGLLADLERSELVRRDVVVGWPVVRPAHPVYGEVLRDGLGPIALRHHSRRLADGAEACAREGVEAGVDVLRVVRWRAASGGDVPAGLLGRAAREARRRAEFDRAEDLARRAVDEGGGPAALLLLGEIQNTRARFEDADATFARVVDPVVAGDGSVEPRLLVPTTLAMAFNRAWGLDCHSEARRLLAAVGDVLAEDGAGHDDPGMDELRAELAADAASLAAFSGAPRLAIADAAPLVETGGAPRVVARAAFALAAGLIGAGRPAAAAQVSERGLAAIDDLPRGFGRTAFTTNLMMTRAVGLAESGRLVEAEAVAVDAYRRSLDVGLRSGQAVSAWARGRILELAGQVETGERWLREARLLERDLRTRGRWRWSLVGLGITLVARGRLGEAEEVVAELDRLSREQPGDDRFVTGEEARLRASLCRAQGELSAAEEILVAGADDAAARGALGSAAVLWHEVLLGPASARVSTEAATRLVALGDDLDGDLHRARVAEGRAHLEGDLAARLDVVDELRRCGAVRAAARVARATAVEARRLGRRGTARSAEEREQRCLAECEGPAPPPDQAVLGGLGPRQREVVLLAGRGLSNQEVADRLGLSVRTIENHLHRAYAVLGVDGRRGLVTLLDPDGAADR